MSEIRCAIELRGDASRESPGHLYGRLMRYGERATDRPERFATGALRWPEDGIVLNRQHQRSVPILRFTPELRGSELWVDAALPDTAAGRDAATEVRDGLLRGLSVEFVTRVEGLVGGLREIREAVLTGAALVTRSSYDAPVEVRAAADELAALTRRNRWR